jgi:hypothetical protein
MWNVLKHNDLAQAEGALQRRRGEMLQRQAEELGQLAADQAEIESLRRLAAIFCDKFHVAAAPTAADAAPATPTQTAPVPREAWRGAQRGGQQSNFATFSGAVARSTL